MERELGETAGSSNSIQSTGLNQVILHECFGDHEEWVSRTEYHKKLKPNEEK
jgi:hypothetical protein